MKIYLLTKNAYINLLNISQVAIVLFTQVEVEIDECVCSTL